MVKKEDCCVAHPQITQKYHWRDALLADWRAAAETGVEYDPNESSVDEPLDGSDAETEE